MRKIIAWIIAWEVMKSIFSCNDKKCENQEYAHEEGGYKEVIEFFYAISKSAIPVVIAVCGLYGTYCMCNFILRLFMFK